MTEPDAFLSAILEDPWSDAPRLIFADWLDEHGQQDRAEFIRLQCALATTQVLHAWESLCACRYCSLRNREWDLMVRLWGVLTADWLFPDMPFLHKAFRRGFIERLQCSAADWLAYGAAVLAAQPVLEVTLIESQFQSQSDRDERLVRSRQMSIAQFVYRVNVVARNRVLSIRRRSRGSGPV